MNRNTAMASLAAMLLLAATGCSSVPDPATVPADMSAAELSQKGQSAFDVSNYKASEVYYQLIIDRFPNSPEVTVGAEFEIAHLRVKQKDWADAKARLDAIVARYETTGGAGLPPEFLVLAKNDLKKIPVKHGGTPPAEE